MDQHQALCRDFIANREEAVYPLPWEQGANVFVGLWRYFRRFDDNNRQHPLEYTEQMNHDAIRFHDQYPQEYNFMLPIFTAITFGKGNEGVGFYTHSNGSFVITAIIRYAYDRYHIMEINADSSIDKDLALLFESNHYGAVIAFSGTSLNSSTGSGHTPPKDN
jgi:hypothetical protein